KATEPPREERETWLTKAYGRFREGAELTQEAMVEPDIPIVKREKPGPREQLAHEYRDITTRARAGELSEEAMKFWWDTTPERVFGNIQAQGLGAGPRLREVRGFKDVAAIGAEAITPVAPEEATKFIRKVPVAGEIVEPHIRGLTAPLGLAAAAKWPAITATMLAGGAVGGVAGKGIERAGVPVADVGPMRVGPSGVLETAGTLAGPVAARPLGRAAMAGARAAPAAGRATVAEIERLIPKAKDVGRRLLTEEAGGIKPKPSPLAEEILARVPDEGMFNTQKAFEEHFGDILARGKHQFGEAWNELLQGPKPHMQIQKTKGIDRLVKTSVAPAKPPTTAADAQAIGEAWQRVSAKRVSAYTPDAVTGKARATLPDVAPFRHITGNTVWREKGTWWFKQKGGKATSYTDPSDMVELDFLVEELGKATRPPTPTAGAREARIKEMER
ncbi:unnamed protein product, partial [marine sediment metagenome]